MTADARRAAAGALLLLLTACNGASPSSGSSALPFAARRTATARSQHLVYVSASTGSSNAVYVYSAAGQGQAPIATITEGISSPAGLAVDASGNLYVANSGNNTVTVYAPGQSRPSLTYSQGVSAPLGVAVGSDGTLYVANQTGSTSGTGSVTEYPAGSIQPSLTISLASEYAYAVALDSNNALYVSWFSFAGYSVAIYKYATEGSDKGEDLNLKLPGNAWPAFAIAFDNRGNLVVPCETLTLQAPTYLAIFAPGANKPKHKIREGDVLDVVGGIAFPREKSNVFYTTAMADRVWMKLTYTKGVPRDVVTLGGPYGIALSF